MPHKWILPQIGCSQWLVNIVFVLDHKHMTHFWFFYMSVEPVLTQAAKFVFQAAGWLRPKETQQVTAVQVNIDPGVWEKVSSEYD